MNNLFNNIAAIMITCLVGLFTYVLTKHCRDHDNEKTKYKCTK